ncbi:MAG: orotidine-5'-phosphate decarboxylase [Candidatus Omnitrophota bacterium]
MKKNNLIVALDLDSFTKAKKFINLLYKDVKLFKVGLQLFINCGHEIIPEIKKKGAEVFLDLKFYDIPNTVSNAVTEAVRLNVKMLTVHISGGKEMLTSAVRTAKKEAKILRIKKPLLIGVTVLTSQETKPSRVLELAKMGLSCGLDGIVCSVKEVQYLRKKINKKFIIVTPGIRPNTQNFDDQKRIASAKEALRLGSDYLVVGRPILEARNPKKALQDMLKE